MTPGRLRFGVLGCADVARRKMIPAMQRCPLVDLVAVASRSRRKAEEVAGEFGCVPEVGYRPLLSRGDVDAIYLPLPPGLHAEWICEALRAGKHVLAEKPLAISRDEAAAIVSSAQSRNLVVMENFMFLHHRQLGVVEDLLARNAVGGLRAFTGTFGYPPLGRPNIRYRSDLGGGALNDAGCYPLRAALHFLGSQLEVAGSVLRRDGTADVDLGGQALLYARDGAVANVSFAMDSSYVCRYELWGTKGRIVAERAFTAPPSLTTTVYVLGGKSRREYSVPPDDNAVRLLETFAHSADVRTTEPHCAQIRDQANLLEQAREVAKMVWA